MSNLQIVSDNNEINLNSQWVDSFKNEKTIVDGRGFPISSNYQGHCYQLITKERHFSQLELIKKKFLVILFIVCSLGCVLFHSLLRKKMMNIFTEKMEKKNFLIPMNSFQNLVVQTRAQPILLPARQSIISCVLPFPKELDVKILSHLDSQDLTRCLSVNNQWKVLADQKSLWDALQPKIAFGKKQWAEYFGNIERAPSLPKNIYKILKSPCPFWPNKKIEETHLLILIPKSVNKKRFNLKELVELGKSPKKGFPLNPHSNISFPLLRQYSTTPNKMYWALVAKKAIPGSENKDYKDQKSLIKKFAEKSKINYDVSNMFEGIICMVVHYVTSKEYLFGKENMVRFRDESSITKFIIQLGAFKSNYEFNTRLSGGYLSNSLWLNETHYNFDNLGIAAIQRIF